MSREKEITKAALDYANNLDDIKPVDDFSRNLCIALGQAFIKGAEWADNHQAEKDQQQTKELLKMLLEAIDYSFAQTDGTYDLALTYPVIDKVKYIKQKLRENKQ